MITVTFKQGDIFTTAMKEHSQLILVFGNFGMMLAGYWHGFVRNYSTDFPLLKKIQKSRDEFLFHEFTTCRYVCFLPAEDESNGLSDAMFSALLKEYLHKAEDLQLGNIITTGIKNNIRTDEQGTQRKIYDERVMYTIDVIEQWIEERKPMFVQNITLISCDQSYVRRGIETHVVF